MIRLMLALCLAAAVAGADQPITVVAFGDSITGDRPRKAYLHQYLKWIDLVGLGLQARGNEVAVVNAGWAGDSTSGKPSGDPPGAVKRLQGDVLDLKPAICVMLIGGNDFSAVRASDPASPAVAQVREALRANLADMVGRMHAAGIKVLLLQYHAARAADPAKAWKHLDWGNATVAEVAAATGAPTLPLESAFAAAIAGGATPEQLVNQNDGVHLNPRGELVLARAVVARLVELGWVR
jgi:lysophospholipase L1-like esterase